jgi:predicted AlkP superfamily pyrophosphatase or phosphodiesterase
MQKFLLIIIDGVPWRNWRRLFGNLEGFVAHGAAKVWRMRSVLPSTSASCYASLHTGLPPQVTGVWGNEAIGRLDLPDIFSAVTAAGGRTGAVAHSFWSELFNRNPFDVVRDIEYDEDDGSIHHGRFHTMYGYNLINQATPADHDLFGTLTRLCERHAIAYGLLHSCTLDSMGHRFRHDSEEMDRACFALDAQLAPFLMRWRDAGYEVIVTADHGQDARGHHGGADELQQDFALYYFGEAQGPSPDVLLDQLALAPTILSLMSVPVPPTMAAAPFLHR